LFAAADAEAAYRVACEWLPGFADANHDGPGDRTKIFALGVHQIEEVLPAPDDLPAAVRELYGVDVGGVRSGSGRSGGGAAGAGQGGAVRLPAPAAVRRSGRTNG
jgi:hypothetical protein